MKWFFDREVVTFMLMKLILVLLFNLLIFFITIDKTQANFVQSNYLYKRDNKISTENVGTYPNLKNKTILLYTRNGVGYVHDNIQDAISCMKQLSVSHQFKLIVTTDASIFNDKDLKQFSLVLFANTNNDVFDNDAERLSFRKYIESGGGFVGIHSVVGTERNWKWFKMLLGETFLWHPPFQQFKIANLKPEHPSMKGIPSSWIKEDECYFGKELYAGMQVLMAHDINSLSPKDSIQIKKSAGSFANLFPAVWWQNFDGGNVWITTLGHDKNNYQDPLFIHHILNGIDFICSKVKKLDYSKAYAISKDDEVKTK